jgi:ubiquitin thioesterase OTU1
MFRVRLRLPSSQETLTLENPSIRTLLEAIRPFVEVDLSEIAVRFVYPPKPIDFGTPAEWDRSLATVGIKNGETLIVTTEKKLSTSSTEAAKVPVQMDVPPQQVPSAPSPQHSREESPEGEQVPVDGGSVVLRVMADDNSCLYFPVLV